MSKTVKRLLLVVCVFTVLRIIVVFDRFFASDALQASLIFTLIGIFIALLLRYLIVRKPINKTVSVVITIFLAMFQGSTAAAIMRSYSNVTSFLFIFSAITTYCILIDQGPLRCEKCGGALKEKDKFCNKCGNKLVVAKNS